MTVRRSIDGLLADAAARIERVQPQRLADEIAAGALVVDIRPVEQRDRDGELPGAVIIDRNVLEWRLDPACDHRLERRPEYQSVPDATTGYDRRIVLVCNEGYQTVLAAANLVELGLERATDVEGGFQALLAEGAVPRPVRHSS